MAFFEKMVGPTKTQASKVLDEVEALYKKQNPAKSNAIKVPLFQRSINFIQAHVELVDGQYSAKAVLKALHDNPKRSPGPFKQLFEIVRKDDAATFVPILRKTKKRAKKIDKPVNEEV